MNPLFYVSVAPPFRTCSRCQGCARAASGRGISGAAAPTSGLSGDIKADALDDLGADLLRQLLHPLNVIDAMEFLRDKLGKTETNGEFIDSMSR